MPLISHYNEPIVSGGNFTWSEYAMLKGFHELATPTPEQFHNAIFLFTQ